MSFAATPQSNPSGYFNGSPINFAKQMKDTQNLLVIHGACRGYVVSMTTIINTDNTMTIINHSDIAILTCKCFDDNTTVNRYWR